MEWKYGKDGKVQAAIEFQAKCAPPIRNTTVHIEEVEDEEDLVNVPLTATEYTNAIEDGRLTDRTTLSPLMQERLKRAMDMKENMVDGFIVPKKKAKAKPAAKAQEGNGSSSSKD